MNLKDKVDILCHNFGICIYKDFWGIGAHVAIHEYDDEAELMNTSDFEEAVNILCTRYNIDDNSIDLVKGFIR